MLTVFGALWQFCKAGIALVVAFYCFKFAWAAINTDPKDVPHIVESALQSASDALRTDAEPAKPKDRHTKR